MTQQAQTSATASAGVDATRAAEIASRNDALRRDRLGGHVMMTAAVAALPPDALAAAILALRRFDDFTADNDPYGEHDFGAFEHAGERFFFKIDTYADASLTFGAKDPLAPGVVRVLTLMLASDY
ncbi:MAG: DUF3768 domain-containing protein [Hyphomicrobiaceae bacterium]|nr:DUF3768 domain-containing protein [Hyphomicrobiaceae bacterium]